MQITRMLNSLTEDTRHRILNRHRLNEGLRNAGKLYTRTDSVYSMSAIDLFNAMRQIEEDNTNENDALMEAWKIFHKDNPYTNKRLDINE